MMDEILFSQLKEVSNSLIRIEKSLLNLQEIITNLAIKIYNDK